MRPKGNENKKDEQRSETFRKIVYYRTNQNSWVEKKTNNISAYYCAFFIPLESKSVKH